MNEKRLQGVIGVIKRDNRYLFGLESKNSPIKGKWRLLGGKLEDGENSRQAMIRECREEAGIEVAVNGFFGIVNGTLRDIQIDRCYCYCESGTLAPKMDEVAELRWFSPEQILKMDLEPLSRKAFEDYLWLERKWASPGYGGQVYQGCDAGAIG